VIGKCIEAITGHKDSSQFVVLSSQRSLCDGKTVENRETERCSLP
jgi:hypothetical protein